MSDPKPVTITIIMDDYVHRDVLNKVLADACEMRNRFAEDECEIQQALGAALGFPWYKDDPADFPNATEADGVCVGVDSVTLARMAADRIRELEATIARTAADPPASIVDTLEALRNAGGDAWDEIDDPEEYLRGE